MLLGRESTHAEEKEGFVKRISTLEKELSALKHSRATFAEERSEMEEKVR